MEWTRSLLQGFLRHNRWRLRRLAEDSTRLGVVPILPAPTDHSSAISGGNEGARDSESGTSAVMRSRTEAAGKARRDTMRQRLQTEEIGVGGTTSEGYVLSCWASLTGLWSKGYRGSWHSPPEPAEFEVSSCTLSEIGVTHSSRVVTDAEARRVCEVWICEEGWPDLEGELRMREEEREAAAREAYWDQRVDERRDK